MGIRSAALCTAPFALDGPCLFSTSVKVLISIQEEEDEEEGGGEGDRRGKKRLKRSRFVDDIAAVDEDEDDEEDDQVFFTSDQALQPLSVVLIIKVVFVQPSNVLQRKDPRYVSL